MRPARKIRGAGRPAAASIIIGKTLHGIWAKTPRPCREFIKRNVLRSTCGFPKGVEGPHSMDVDKNIGITEAVAATEPAELRANNPKIDFAELNGYLRIDKK